MDSPASIVDEFMPYKDEFDILIGVVLGAIIFEAWYFDWLSVSLAVAIATAVGVFTAIYKRRHGEKITPAVRQAYFTDPEGGKLDFGLQNFGPGPALYVQLQIKNQCDETLFTLKPRERPLHLQQGDTIGVVHDDRISNDQIREELEGLDEEAKENEMVYLHYSYLSEGGIREPVKLNGTVERQDECIFEELQDLNGDPRRMELTAIRSECLPQTEKG